MAKQQGRTKGKIRGDLNRKSQHKMRTHDGMVSSGHFKRTPCGLVRVK